MTPDFRGESLGGTEVNLLLNRPPGQSGAVERRTRSGLGPRGRGREVESGASGPTSRVSKVFR